MSRDSQVAAFEYWQRSPFVELLRHLVGPFWLMQFDLTLSTGIILIKVGRLWVSSFKKGRALQAQPASCLPVGRRTHPCVPEGPFLKELTHSRLIN